MGDGVTGARHTLHNPGPICYCTDGSPSRSVTLTNNLERIAKIGKGAAEIRKEFHSRLGQMARELAKELYPDGMPRSTKFSELEAIAGTLGDEMTRQLIEINVQE